MTMTNSLMKPGEVKISCHDPRHHQEFLLLSHSINTWKDHLHDRSWWLAQENQCLAFFKQHGYDLQTGVWFCLIGCQRHGWAGMANATMLLAEGFTKKQRQCWPPVAAADLRQQIIEWYTTHAANCIFGLPLTSVEADTLLQLEGAVSMIFDQAQSLQSRSQISLRNVLDYLRSNRQALQKRVIVAKSVIPAAPQVSVEMSSPPLSTHHTFKQPVVWKVWLAGGMTGIALTLCVVSTIHWLNNPSTAIWLEKIWPGNALSVHANKQIAEQIASLPTVNSWARVNHQLNNLEQRLLDAEQKRKPYMTISELKTEIYQMRQTLQQGGEPVLAQLDDLQRKIDDKQMIGNAEIDAISQRLTALNSRLIQLTSQQQEK